MTKIQTGLLAILLPITLLLSSCSQDKKPSKPKLTTGFLYSLQQGEPVLTVLSSDDTPLAQAQILIGEELDTPFAGNFLTTDDNGQVALPTDWATELPVTVQAAGHVRLTYLNQAPGNLTLKLRKLPSVQQFEVRGVAKNLPIQNKDGFIDFAMMMTAFTKKDILNFDINNFISPQTDRINEMGQDLDIPANVSIPAQEEKYLFFTVNLDKPTYRIYPQPGINRVYAARARMPFKTIVDELQNGASFYDLINYMKINGGVMRDIDVTTPKTTLDLPMRELNFTDSQEILAPTFRADETYIAVGVSSQSGLLVPTDIKKATSNRKLSLGNLPNTEQLVLGMLKKTADLESMTDRMSITLIPLTAGVTPQALPLIGNPVLKNGEIVLPAITPVAGVASIATYSVLSQEIEVLQGAAKVKIPSPLWDVYARQWITGFKIPVWPGNEIIKGKKRWEVSFVGSQNTSHSVLGPAMIEGATHVTHSSISF